MQTTGGATALMYACQQCMENEVLDLIRKQPNSVKDRDRTSKTPIHYCAENPNTSCAEIVLRAAPELVNAQDDNGYSPLHLAVIAGNKPLIKLLISKGADVNVHDNEGHSAVHWAIVSSEKEALEMIFRAGANPSTADIHGGYPLHYAVQMCGSICDHLKSFEDAVRVVETLLNFGVDVNVKDKDGRQPILWAASAGSPEAVIHLVSSGACVEAADKDGLTALHCAASRGHTTTLETLITLCGANVDVIDGNGCSALFYSVTLGHADATELLLQLGAEPNRQDRKGRTSAHCGAAKGQIETLRILQKHGGNLWVRNVKGDIPLHEAVASGRIDLVLWLLSQNPEAINIANNDGRCPLHIASMYNNTEMVKVLLDSKSLVNPIMRTSKGVLMTPLNVALCKGHRSCGKYLQLHGGVPFSKVARLEPASAFAVRISPSDEMMVKSPDTGRDISPDPNGKISKSRSSVDIRESQEIDKSGSEKKKVYRRRKKKRSASAAPSEDSDSDESIQNVKTNTLGSRKVKKSIGMEEGIKVEKVRSARRGVNVGQNPKNNSHTDSSGEAGEISQKAKKVTKRKVLLSNKSFNETKNVSNLSPEDFPPLMQTINQLDVVMMEPDIEEDKVGGEERSSREQGADPVGSGGSRKAVEGRDEENGIETVSIDTIENVRNGIEMTEDKIEKIAMPSQEKSVKTVNVRQEEGKSADSKKTDSTGDDGLNRKSEKSPKTSNNSSSVKKEERSSKSEKTSSANSNESEKRKKAVRPKSPKKSDRTKAKSPGKKPFKNKDENNGEKILNPEKKTDEEIKENENEKPKGEPATEILSDGVILKDSKQSKIADSPEIKNPEGVADSEDKGENNNLNSSEKDEREKNMATHPDNNANSLELEPSSDVLNPKEESEIAVGNENVDIIVTEKEESKSAVGTENVDVTVPEKEESGNPVGTENVDVIVIEKEESKSAMGTENVDVIVTEKGESESAVGTENVDIIITEKEERQQSPLEENAIKGGDEIRTSAVAVEEPSDSGRQENVKEHIEIVEEPSPAVPSSDTPPAHNASGNGTPNDAELPAVRAEDETNKEDFDNVAGKTVTDTETSNEKVKEQGVFDEDVTLEKDITQKGVDEVHEIQNEGRPLENGEFHYNVLSGKSDGDQKPPKLTRVSRLCRRQRDFKGNLNDVSVTQLVQNTLRKYHMERGIFYQLLELKRYQIRSGKANEQVLVKRLVDEYERSRALLGMKPFSGLYKFRDFEKFLYDQLKALNARRSFLIPEMKSYDDIDAMSGFLKKSRYKIINEVPQPETFCTCITQRCHHSACAYTSVPCSGYVADLRRFRGHKTRKESFLPRIEQPVKSDIDRISNRPPTLELIQGTEKHVITLPQKNPGKGKRYYVTFTIKSAPVLKEEDVVEDSKNLFKHRHAKSV